MISRNTLYALAVVCIIPLGFLIGSNGTNGGNWSVTVDAGQNVGQFNPLVLGSNLNWVNEGDGIYDPVTGKVRADAANLTKAMGITMLRFPGGSLSEHYNWKKGIGPIYKRGKGPDYEKKPQKMDFGLDEFLRFCEAQDITPVYTVGYSNNTPETAAQIVEYCNGPVSSPFGKLRADNGHPEPYGVKYWEIGNEVYNKGINEKKATAYGRKVSAMSKRMKEVDPAIQVGAIGLGVSKVWDNAVLGECAGDVDFLIYHRYFPNASSSDAVATDNAVIASAEKMIREIKALQGTASGYKPALTVAVTEYNLDFRDKSGNFINKPSDTQQALFIAECIRQFQLGGVSFATKWDLAHSNRYYFSDINFNLGSQITLSPSYFVQQLYANSGMDTLVNARTVSPTISVLSFGEIQAMVGVPVLTAIAGTDKSGGTLSVVVINRDLYKSYTLNMGVVNFGNFTTVGLTSMKTPPTGPADHFIIENSSLTPSALASLQIPAGSISLFRISH